MDSLKDLLDEWETHRREIDSPIAAAQVRAALRSSESDSGMREAARAAYLFLNMLRCADCGLPWPEGYVHDGCRLSTPHTETSDRIENGWSEYDAPPPGDSDR